MRVPSQWEVHYLIRLAGTGAAAALSYALSHNEPIQPHQTELFSQGLKVALGSLLAALFAMGLYMHNPGQPAPPVQTEEGQGQGE